MKVNVIGLGYIGLPTSLIIAKAKIDVLGVDKKKKVVDNLNSGKIHIKEPYLYSLLKESLTKKKFKASRSPQSADIFIICVPTPLTKNSKPDLKSVYDSIHEIAPLLKKGNLVLLESTVPVGTTIKIAEKLQNLRADLIFPTFEFDGMKPDIFIAHCPERVLPGNILHELQSNSRVIGGVSKFCGKKAKNFYSKITKGDCIITDSSTAELCKLSENSYRDVNIAFANEISMISDKFNINTNKLIKIANKHPRVNILDPGIGVGGHCIAVDPWFIYNSAKSSSKLIKQARQVNNSKTQYVFKKINNRLKNVTNKKILFLGLTYKANVDDIRESPALKIVKKLSKSSKNTFYVADPNIKKTPLELNKYQINFIDYIRGIKTCDIIIILVKHSEFYKVKFQNYKKKEIIDAISL